MRRTDLVRDCGSCAALCCVATTFDASEDFAFAKPAGVRCPYLTRRCACGIHKELAVRGFLGCVAYDCHGAGQRATRAFAAEDEATRLAAFLVLRGVHELLWLLAGARVVCTSEGLMAELAACVAELEAIAESEANALVEVDLAPLHGRAHELLRRVGAALGGGGRLVAISRLRAAR